MKIRQFAAAVIMSLAVLACHDSGGPSDSGESGGTIRVLFIGNSLTYSNDLPGLVEDIAAASGKSIKTESLTYPNFALIDHWSTEERRVVAEGNFDYVVLQQGPSSLDVNRDSLRMWTAMWAPEIRHAGARPVLFAVWPESSRMFAFSAVSESYRLAADDVDGLFVPVGDIWLEVWNSSPNAPLYGPDGYHPDIAGSYAAAIAIVSVLTHTEATALSPDYPSAHSDWGVVASDLAATIRAAARSVMDRTGLLSRQ